MACIDMSSLAVLCALGFLIFVAYRGASVILFAPIAALLAILLTGPELIMPVFSGVFTAKLAEFVQRYFPLFLLGAVFGKMIEIAGFSRAIAKALIRIAGPAHAMFAILLVCNVLTYGGVSLFVVVFAAYPFAAAAFRASGIPKRFIPGTIALGALTYTMDCLPGSPQIQNLIPAPFFGTDAYAAPYLGIFGAIIIFIAGSTWLKLRIRAAQAAGEGYGDNHRNEPETGSVSGYEPSALVALIPLILVGVLNKFLTGAIPHWYGDSYVLALPGLAKPITLAITEMRASWALLIALAAGILATAALAPKQVAARFSGAMRDAVAGSLLAIMNTSSEYGFGAVMAALPGFLVIKSALHAIPTPLLNEAVSVSTLAGVTGSASGGLSIALAALAPQFKAAGTAAGIAPEVLHRIASMASGGMDTLPHNGAVITILAVTGLTHREAYADIFAITLIKTSTVFLVIGLYYLTGLT
jgi:H+/gluconate symporter-like permease